MRALGITFISLALTTAVIGNAYYRKKQFYPSVVYITKSNPSMAVIYIQAFILVFLMGKLMRKVFFGELRAAEFEHLMERSWYAVTETCLAFTLFRDDFSPKFVALFTLLLFLKSFHWLAEDRVDFMERSPVISLLFHVRVLSLLSILGALDFSFISHAYQSTVTKGASVQLVFGFEYAILATIILNIAIKYVLHTVDLNSENPWESKTVFLLYTEVIMGFIKVCLYVTFVVIMIRLYTLPLFAFRPMYYTMRKFKQACNDVILSRRAIQNMNTLYPDATPEELAAADNVCIICREEMTTASKKLPCNHIFHTSCLRSWFQRQQTCPTCRLNILRTTTPRTTAPPPQQPRPGFPFQGLNGAFFGQPPIPPPPIPPPPPPPLPQEVLRHVFRQFGAPGNFPFWQQAPPAPPQTPNGQQQQQQQQQQQNGAFFGQPPNPPLPPEEFFRQFGAPGNFPFWQQAPPAPAGQQQQQQQNGAFFGQPPAPPPPPPQEALRQVFRRFGGPGNTWNQAPGQTPATQEQQQQQNGAYFGQPPAPPPPPPPQEGLRQVFRRFGGSASNWNQTPGQTPAAQEQQQQQQNGTYFGQPPVPPPSPPPQEGLRQVFRRFGGSPTAQEQQQQPQQGGQGESSAGSSSTGQNENESTDSERRQQPQMPPFWAFPPFFCPALFFGMFPPPPMPPSNFSGLSDEDLRRMEGEARENIEARLQCLRQIELLLDASVTVMQQYMTTVTATNIYSNSARKSPKPSGSTSQETSASSSSQVPNDSAPSSSEPAEEKATKAEVPTSKSEEEAASASTATTGTKDEDPSSSEQKEIRRLRLQKFGNEANPAN